MAATWFSVTVVSRSSPCRVCDRGTLPCTAATSAVGPAAPDGPAGSRAPARARPAAAAKANAGTARRRIEPLTRGHQQPGQRGPGQGHQERQQRRAADRHPADRRRLGLAHGQPAPGEGVGPPVAEGLRADPPARDEHRPGWQPQHQPLADREHREDHGLGDGEGGPRVPGEVDQPGDQRDEERQAEAEPDQRTSRAGSAATARPRAAPGRRPRAARSRSAGRRPRAPGRRPTAVSTAGRVRSPRSALASA